MNTDVFARDGVARFVRVDVWFVAALGIRVWWEAAGGWAAFFNHGWTRINTDVLRWMESQDLSVWVGVHLWFVTLLCFDTHARIDGGVARVAGAICPLSLPVLRAFLLGIGSTV